MAASRTSQDIDLFNAQGQLLPIRVESLDVDAGYSFAMGSDVPTARAPKVTIRGILTICPIDHPHFGDRIEVRHDFDLYELIVGNVSVVMQESRVWIDLECSLVATTVTDNPRPPTAPVLPRNATVEWVATSQIITHAPPVAPSPQKNNWEKRKRKIDLED